MLFVLLLTDADDENAQAEDEKHPNRCSEEVDNAELVEVNFHHDNQHDELDDEDGDEGAKLNQLVLLGQACWHAFGGVLVSCGLG